jgi:hypothetical protein
VASLVAGHENIKKSDIQMQETIPTEKLNQASASGELNIQIP